MTPSLKFYSISGLSIPSEVDENGKNVKEENTDDDHANSNIKDKRNTKDEHLKNPYDQIEIDYVEHIEIEAAVGGPHLREIQSPSGPGPHLPEIQSPPPGIPGIVQL